MSESTGITVLVQFTGSETFTHTTAFQRWNYIQQFSENIQKGAKNYAPFYFGRLLTKSLIVDSRTVRLFAIYL